MTAPWPLPADWRWMRFAESARVASNLVDPSEYPDFPHIAPNHIESQTGRLLPHTTIRNDGVTSPKHLFRPGQVLYSKIRPYLAKVVLVDFEGLCSADMYPIESDVVDSRYLKWWMLHPEFTKLAAGQQARTVLPKINRRALDQLPVPVPPKNEQLRIVDLLEDHLSRLDAADTLARQASRRMRSLDEAIVLRHLLPGAAGQRNRLGAVASGELPSLPTEWRWSKLGDVADVVGGVTLDAKRQVDPSYVEVPYLRVANVQRARLDLGTVTTIRVQPARAAALRLRHGDVLMNEGGDRDKLARGWVWRDEIKDCIHQNHVFRARPHIDQVLPEWLAWCANTYGARWAQRHGRQSVNLASISLSTIRRMPIPVAPLAYQERALSEIAAIREQNDALGNAVDCARKRAAALRRSLLTAAFSGSLSGQSSDFDRAEELTFA